MEHSTIKNISFVLRYCVVSCNSKFLKHTILMAIFHGKWFSSLPVDFLTFLRSRDLCLLSRCQTICLNLSSFVVNVFLKCSYSKSFTSAWMSFHLIRTISLIDFISYYELSVYTAEYSDDLLYLYMHRWQKLLNWAGGLPTFWLLFDTAVTVSPDLRLVKHCY